MRNTKNNIAGKFLWLMVMFFLIGAGIYAQDSSMTKSTSPQSTDFKDYARQLSNELVSQIGISSDQADKVSQILVDYQKNIADIRDQYLKNKSDADNNQDVTGGQSRVDMTGILGNDVEPYYQGATPQMISDYKDADQKTDSKIKDLLDSDTQKTQYEQIKGSWWSDVKNKVFTSLGQNMQQQTK